jgi:two-component system response regulator PilR (NtrC family)
MPSRILIVDDDDIVRESLAVVLSNRGFECRQATDGQVALDILLEEDFDVVITDLEMPRINGLDLLERSRQIQTTASFILITAYGSMETAIQALRKGAFDYLLKPLNFEDLAIKIQKLIEHKDLILENEALRQEIHSQYDFSNIVGQSEAIQNVISTIKKVSDSDSNILIGGKSGTGKELVARTIHYNSIRQKGPFVAINCGAITESLFESELFGHKKGSFTDAVSDKEGLFRMAHRGSLFLDEIGELSLSSQSKLLRSLETREILPVGATAPQKVDIRVIAATNQNLKDRIKLGTFREDLYYRLNVIEINLPSLNERREDIPLLIRHFIRKYNRQMNRAVKGVEPGLMSKLVNRSYRGEVRELENLLERLMIFSNGSVLTLDGLPPDLREETNRFDVSTQHTTLKAAVEDFERRHILQQLEKNDYHRGRTAKELQIGDATLYRKMKELGIDKCDVTLNG